MEHLYRYGTDYLDFDISLFSNTRIGGYLVEEILGHRSDDSLSLGVSEAMSDMLIGKERW